MIAVKVASAALGLTIGVLAAVPASAWDRKDASVTILQTLPALVDINNALTALKSSAEGITVGLPAIPGRAADNNIYVVTSGVNNGVTPIPPDSPANLFVIRPDGTFLRGGVPCVPGPATPCSLHIGNSSAFALGLRFNPVTGRLWVLDAGVPKILDLDPITGATSTFPIIFQDNATLNALTFDGDGNGYVSDSANGRIYRITRGGEAATIWSSGGGGGDPLLLPAPGLSPPVGVNGIEFNPPQCRPAVLPCELFAANTANRTILRIIADANGNAFPATVFVNGINGPDGVAIDSTTIPANIWVASNQSDEIVVIQSGGATPGRVIAKLGDFDGLEVFGPGGAQRRVREFLFPASLAFSNLPVPPGGQRMLYVTNLASPNMRAIDSPWAALVTDYTVSQLPVPMIPPTGCFTGPGNC
jgi:DNA-binding beta-propeller fold protein YncE